MAYNIIPLTSDPDQKFLITIPVDGKNITLNLRVRYNSIGNYWWLTIADKSNKILLDSIPLVTGAYPAADILGQYKYLGLGSAAIVKVGSTFLDIPDNTNLGTDFVLCWGDTI